MTFVNTLFIFVVLLKTDIMKEDREHIVQCIIEGLIEGENPDWQLNVDLFKRGIKLTDMDREWIASQIDQGFNDGTFIIGEECIPGYWNLTINNE